jgi:carboxy-cis,cis-muconate cyclase
MGRVYILQICKYSVYSFNTLFKYCLNLNNYFFIFCRGRNCIWTYSVNAEDGTVSLGSKHISPREDDGPRHTWPHPNGNYLYCVQEHSSMVDVFEVKSDGTTLEHINGVSILPEGKSAKLFWADEVRVSHDNRFLFASNRGLKPETKGYVLAFALEPSGLLSSTEPITIWETPTSGGRANAIEPAPFNDDGMNWLALTDSEQGFVMILSFDGEKFDEVARITLPNNVEAATVVWID